MLLIAGHSAMAAENGWTIQTSTSGSVTTFTISRTNTAVAETVKYRFVNLSAYAGQHYKVTAINDEPVETAQQTAALSGEFSFAAGDTESRTIQVTELAGSGAYAYQTGTTRSYRLEVTDIGGFHLTECDRSFTTGTKFSADKVSKSITNLVYFNSSGSYTSDVSSSKYVDVAYTPPTSQVETSGTLSGYVLIDDSYDYAQKPATVSTSSLINSTGATASYLQNTLKYKIYATVCFTEKEKDDGYQYVQIIAGTSSTSYDTGYDPEGSVNDPVNSAYKVCFELSDGSNAEGKQFFPHRYSYANKTAETSAGISITEFSQTNGKLWQQKFKSGYQATNSGSLIFDADVTNITTRFDAGGNNDDTWGYKDFFVRMALVDATAPTKQTVSVAPGKHAKGNPIYVSVTFNEIVKVTGKPTLSTNNSWGSLSYLDGSGTNVLTFSGTIGDNASGNLIVTGYSGTITDLAGNAPASITSSNLCSLDDSYAYSISYDLADGAVATANPTTYTYETAVTINNQPILAAGGYVFAGWTGSNGNTPQTTVTIPAGSHGNKSYTANWTPLWGQDNGATGEEAHPYIISSTAGLDMLAKVVNGTDRYNANDFSGKFFKLANDITYTHTTDWDNANSTENNYTAIGRQSGITYFFFKGTFDGDNHTISGIRIYKGGNNNADSCQGLFGCVGASDTVKGTVKNVTLSDTRIAGYTAVGTISGENNGDVINCHAAATVVISAVSIYPANYHGGIVGQNGKGGTICNCTGAARLTSNFQSTWYYGAIAGQNAGTGSVKNCLAVGASIPSMEKNYGVIVGYNNGGTLTNNYYRNCTVGDTANATNVGVGNSTNAPADQDGARSVHELALPTGVTATGESVEISSSTYYAAGTTVTLSYSNLPDGGSVIYNVNGTAIDGSSFTMPAGDVTVTAQLLNTVSYIDADGNEQTHACIPIVSGTTTYGDSNNAEGWYSVSGDVTIDGTRGVKFLDRHVNIILCDGATLTSNATTEDFNGIDANNGSLTIYAQSGGTGRIVATAKDMSAINAKLDMDINGGIISAITEGAIGINTDFGYVTIRRGRVTAQGTIRGISAYTNLTILGGTVSVTATRTDAGSGLSTFHDDVSIFGGNVTAKGYNGIQAGIGNPTSITLGCVTPADRIIVSSYACSTLTIADGQTLTDGTATYTGTLNAEQIAAIAGKTMTPYVAPSPDLTLVQGTKDGVTAYWGTFYDSGSGYTLPAGAAAYTMDAEYHLYRLGTDGSVIPKATAVVIIADKADVSLTTLAEASAADNAPGGNILVGRDVATSFDSVICVLSVSASGAVGFYPLSGIALPAHKAGYVAKDGLKDYHKEDGQQW